MTYFFTVAISSSESAPSSTYTLALRTSGRSPWLMSWMHWLAESARWSNWPGSASTANMVAPFAMGAMSLPGSSGFMSARLVRSVCGSLNTVGTHCSHSSSEMPSTS